MADYRYDLRFTSSNSLPGVIRNVCEVVPELGEALRAAEAVVAWDELSLDDAAAKGEIVSALHYGADVIERLRGALAGLRR